MKQHGGAMMPFITIDKDSLFPIYRQLENQFRAAILGSALSRGTRLPASRVLAQDLGISRPTIVKVLENLTSEGYLEARQGSGTFVASDLPPHLPPPAKASERLRSAEPRELCLSRIGDLFQAVTADLTKATYRPFLPNHPAFDEFPFATWRKCWNRQTRLPRIDMMGYGDPTGYGPLKRCIAEYLAIHRGDKCDPEQIVITPGAHAAFALAALLLADPGDTVWFEDPGPLTVRSLFVSLGLKIGYVALDIEGMDVAAAARDYPEARLAFTMPSRQHPLGVTLSLARRLAMLEWARRTGSWIIEDDYDSEFRYVGRPLPSMRSVGGSDRVIYVGTFSKALFPSIRVGYIVLPPALVGTFRNAIGLIARSVPADIQAVLADFIGDGHFVTHLRRMRDLYAYRRTQFIAAARETLSDLADVTSPDSGMNAIAWLNEGMSDTAIYLDAVGEGIHCYPLSDYAVRPSSRPALILGFTGVKQKDLRPGLNGFAAVISREKKRGLTGL